MYLASVLFLSAPLWLLLAALQLSQFMPSADDNLVGWFVFGGMFLVAALMFYLQAIHFRCWRCKAPLSLSPLDWHCPIILWTKCPKCGVRHSARRVE